VGGGDDPQCSIAEEYYPRHCPVVLPELSSSFMSRFRCRCFSTSSYSSSVHSITQLRYQRQRAEPSAHDDGRRLDRPSLQLARQQPAPGTIIAPVHPIIVIVIVILAPRDGLEQTRAPGWLLLLLPGRAVDRMLFRFFMSLIHNSSCLLRIDDDSPPSRKYRDSRPEIDRSACCCYSDRNKQRPGLVC
jgi:hypothetical protein